MLILMFMYRVHLNQLKSPWSQKLAKSQFWKKTTIVWLKMSFWPFYILFLCKEIHESLNEIVLKTSDAVEGDLTFIFHISMNNCNSNSLSMVTVVTKLLYMSDHHMYSCLTLAMGNGIWSNTQVRLKVCVYTRVSTHAHVYQLINVFV